MSDLPTATAPRPGGVPTADPATLKPCDCCGKPSGTREVTVMGNICPLCRLEYATFLANPDKFDALTFKYREGRVYLSRVFGIGGFDGGWEAAINAGGKVQRGISFASTDTTSEVIRVLRARVDRWLDVESEYVKVVSPSPLVTGGDILPVVSAQARELADAQDADKRNVAELERALRDLVAFCMSERAYGMTFVSTDTVPELKAAKAVLAKRDAKPE